MFCLIQTTKNAQHIAKTVFAEKMKITQNVKINVMITPKKI
jgi:hypothetical protein